MDADRLSELPDCLLHMILSSLGSRLALQTSVLSRRWRHLWRDMPCVNMDEREFNGISDLCSGRFEDFADHTLTSIPPGTLLDAFRLHLVFSVGSSADRWIRRGLRYFPATVEIHAAPDDTSVCWEAHVATTGLCAAGFTQRLTTLRLVGVTIFYNFVENLGQHCPVLEELHLERCDMYMYTVSSPTLRRLVIVGPQHYLLISGGPLRLTVPRLASMRLEIKYGGGKFDGVPNLEPLPLLTQASIRLINTFPYEDFLRSMPGFLALLPNVVNLHLSGFTIPALLKEESQEFPLLHNLRILLLEECDLGEKFQALKGILPNTPNLEKIGLHQCTFVGTVAPKGQKKKAFSKRHSLANLKSVEVKSRQEDEATLAKKVLAVISKGMTPAQLQQVITSTTIL